MRPFLPPRSVLLWYNGSMTPKLTDEMRQAIEARKGEPVLVEDEQTHRIYVIVDSETHQRAMRALKRQEDHAAIQAGIDDMEAGRVIPLEEVDRQIRNELGFGPAT